MSYYTRWRYVIGTPLFQKFIRRNYERGLEDLRELGRQSPFSKKQVSCLLCGVGNEETARSFIEFALSKNSRAKIVIIDLGTEQIEAVRELVAAEYGQLDITVKQMNALDLRDEFSVGSFDWIDTDGFLEFFMYEELLQLLGVWHELLKKDGYISLREPASKGWVEALLDAPKVKIAKWWLGIDIYAYSLVELERMFEQVGFEWVVRETGVVSFRRFCLVRRGEMKEY